MGIKRVRLYVRQLVELSPQVFLSRPLSLFSNSHVEAPILLSKLPRRFRSTLLPMNQVMHAYFSQILPIWMRSTESDCEQLAAGA